MSDRQFDLEKPYSGNKNKANFMAVIIKNLIIITLLIRSSFVLPAALELREIKNITGNIIQLPSDFF